MTDNLTAGTHGNHWADGPDNIDHIRTMHDPGAHEFIREGFEELYEALARDAANPDTLSALVTTARILRDEALSVRQVVPTGFNTAQVATSGAVPVQVAYGRRERLSVTLVNMGTGTVYIGATQATAQPTSGFPIPAGGALTLSSMCDVWASDNGTSCVVGILDEYRSESDGA